MLYASAEVGLQFLLVLDVTGLCAGDPLGCAAPDEENIESQGGAFDMQSENFQTVAD